MKSVLLKEMGCLMLSFTLIFAGCNGKNTSGSAAKTGSSRGKSSGKETPASDFSYDLSKDGAGILIKGYTGKGGAVVIPTMIEDLPVVAIYDNVFTGGGYKGRKPSDAITSLVLLQPVVFIDGQTGRAGGTSIFSDMENLTSITLPEGWKEISVYTFSSCPKLTKVNLPASLEEIGWCAFSGCGELKEIVIPASLTGVKFFWDMGERPDNFAFKGCGKLPIKTRQAIQAWGYQGDF